MCAVVLRRKAWARATQEINVVPGAFEALARREIGEPRPALLPLLHRAGEMDLPAIGGSPVAVHTHAPTATPGSSLPFWSAAAIDGFMPGVEVWEKWHSVDENVFRAVEHLTHQQIDGFGDLLRVVNAREWAVETDGFVRMLSGHVGEFHVHDHLVAAGHEVVTPLTSNQAGFDFLTDGTPVNVKTVADAGGLHAHFADYPDIPVIVPVDAADIPADALYFDPSHPLEAGQLVGDHHVLVDGALSHADVLDQTTHATDVLQDPGLDGGHIPWVTMAVSTLREGRLLVKGDTDLARAAKNVAVDTAAVGGGTAVGAKAGAIMGLPFGPLGSVVGGVAGAIGGAMLGRKAANAIKRGPLDESQRDHAAARDAYEQAARAVAREAEGAWYAARDAVQREHRAAVAELTTSHVAALRQAQAQLRSATVLTQAQADAELTRAGQVVDNLVETAQRLLHKRARGPARLLAPFVATDEWATYGRLRRDARAWRVRADQILSAGHSLDRLTAETFDLLLALPGYQGGARRFIRGAAEARIGAFSALAGVATQLLSGLAARRRRAILSLRQQWDRIQAKATDDLSPPLDSLRRQTERYKGELRKAGVAV